AGGPPDGRPPSRLDLAAVLVGAAALVGWDLFLDPQMVDAGHWVWAPTAAPHLNGIPITNTIGWAAVALTLMVVLNAVVPWQRAADDRVPLALFGWTYASEVLGQAVFFGHPAVALAGGLGMGVVVAALILSTRVPTLLRP
ncbi:MAG: carotenoid biosynthesis protein, partial [Acidimicrobiales bacterium]